MVYTQWGYRDREGHEHVAESQSEAMILGNQVGFTVLSREVDAGPWVVTSVPL